LSLSIALIRAPLRRIPASGSTNEWPKKGGLSPQGCTTLLRILAAKADFSHTPCPQPALNGGQIVFSDRLEVHHTPPDSGERQ